MFNFFNKNKQSNLLKNDVAEVDMSIIKISIIAAIGIVAAIIASYFTSMVYKQPTSANFILATAFIFIFIIIFFFQSIFIKSPNLNTLIAIGETLGLASFLMTINYSFITIIGILITFIAFYTAIKSIHRELQSQLLVKIIKLARFSIPKIVAAVIILISLIYSEPFFPENINISKNLIKSILGPAETIAKITDNYLKIGLSNFSIEKPLSELNLSYNGIEIPAVALQQQLMSLGMNIKADESILDAVYNLANSRMKDFNQITKWTIFGSVFLLVFLTIKSLFWLLYWLIYILIYLIYEILMALGFCKLTYEQISKEIIVL